jgi:hypothetical protein
VVSPSPRSAFDRIQVAAEAIRAIHRANNSCTRKPGHLGRLNESILQAARFRPSRGHLEYPAVPVKSLQASIGHVCILAT